ncbi:MAG: trigger factor [Candidatus Melainabacteria bacterium]|nr:MAG: trigger factor [Candidatus Melainabacteria bacterium]
MKVTLEREGKNIIRMGLELESDKADKAYELACRQLAGKINIPGFRRGKAPRNIIEKTLGVDYIKREALERLVPELLTRAILDENLDVITEPEIDNCDFELGAPLKLNAKFEVRPEVTLGQYLGISAEVPEAVMPEDALDKALQSVAESKSSMAPVPDREVKMGDTVLMDFECKVDGEVVEGGKAQGLLLELREGAFLEGFCEQVVGKMPNTDFEVEAKFPPAYRNKELAGKDAKFSVSLKEIRERTIPDVNEELAKEVGYENLDQLKDFLKERIQEEIKQENDMRSQRAVVDAVVAQAKVDIPETMIEREQQLLMHQLKRYFEQTGQPFEEFERSEEFKGVKDSKFEEAKQRVLTSLVLGAVVRQEKMTVQDEEMTPYIAELVQRYQVPVEQVARNEEVRRQIMEEVLTNKVVEYLVSKANIKFVEEPAHEHGPGCEHDHDHEHGKEDKAKAKADKKPEAKKEAEAEADKKPAKKAEAKEEEKPKEKAGKKGKS